MTRFFSPLLLKKKRILHTLSNFLLFVRSLSLFVCSCIWLVWFDWSKCLYSSIREVSYLRFVRNILFAPKLTVPVYTMETVDYVVLHYFQYFPRSFNDPPFTNRLLYALTAFIMIPVCVSAAADPATDRDFIARLTHNLHPFFF